MSKNKKDISLGDLFACHLGDNLMVGDKLLDIRRDANAVGTMTKATLDENGEFAKVYASTILERMESIAKEANEALELLIMNNADVIPAKLTPPPPKENLLVI
jgi:hypothetical protein